VRAVTLKTREKSNQQSSRRGRPQVAGLRVSRSLKLGETLDVWRAPAWNVKRGSLALRSRCSRASVSPEQLVAVLHTDNDGRYDYTATRSMDRTLRFAYPGSPLILPDAGGKLVELQVPVKAVADIPHDAH
jgi:hypothetical protein